MSNYNFTLREAEVVVKKLREHDTQRESRLLQVWLNSTPPKTDDEENQEYPVPDNFHDKNRDVTILQATN